jgi:hypothetical protein
LLPAIAVKDTHAVEKKKNSGKDRAIAMPRDAWSQKLFDDRSIILAKPTRDPDLDLLLLQSNYVNVTKMLQMLANFVSRIRIVINGRFF